MISQTLDMLQICRSSITWEKAEDMKMEHCYVAEDYLSELELFQVEVCFSLCFIFFSLYEW